LGKNLRAKTQKNVVLRSENERDTGEPEKFLKQKKLVQTRNKKGPAKTSLRKGTAKRGIGVPSRRRKEL